MADYTSMSAYYDLIMTSGYYDYDAIVSELARTPGVSTVVEVGAGTGLVLERLVAECPELSVTGIDFTQAMLDIAATRLAHCPQVTLYRQDVVELCLSRVFDLAFSYGGVWYFVPDGDSYIMISHIRDDDANAEGLCRLGEHVVTGGRLLLGVQAPHADYAAPVAQGLRYSQRIVPISGGFRKHYRLDDPSADGAPPVMEQTTDYRMYPFHEALDLLDKAGFGYCEQTGEAGSLFLEFGRR